MGAMKIERIIVFLIVIVLLFAAFSIYNAGNNEKNNFVIPSSTNAIYALPEILDSGIANHTDGQYNNITLNPGGSIYIYGATDGGGQPFSSTSNYTPIFYASNNHIGTNSVEGYSASNGAISPYGSPITQKAIGGISIGYPNAINASVGHSMKYFQAMGDVKNISVTSMNYEFNVTGSEKLAVFFMEGSNYINPIVNTNFQISKLNELNGPLLFIYLAYSILNPGSYKINLTMTMASNNSLACDSILGIYLFPELTFTPQIKQTSYPVMFNENGLPPGSKWGVIIGSNYYNSTNNTIIFYEPNGTYFYQVFTSTNYYASIPQGNFTVQGRPVNISVLFSTTVSQAYTVSFYAKGLPNGLSWSVTFNGQTKSSTNDYINFTAPNGVYSWSYSLPSPYHATITPEKITVDNQSVDVIIPVISTTSISPSGSGPSPLLMILIIVIIIIVVIIILFILMRRKRPKQYGQGPDYYGQQAPPGPPPNYPPPQQQYPGPYPGPVYQPQTQTSNQNVQPQAPQVQGMQGIGQGEMMLLNLPGASLTTIDGRKISTIPYSGSIVITDKHFIFASKGKKATAITGALAGGIFAGMVSKEMTRVDLSNIQQELTEPGSFILDLSNIGSIIAKPSGLSRFSNGKLNITSKVPVSPNGLGVTGYAIEFSFMPKGYPGGTDLKKNIADYINTTIAQMVGK
ncbi:MAG: hypothetical protein ACP5LV_05700 [Thermoplasmata archaeon]